MVFLDQPNVADFEKLFNMDDFMISEHDFVHIYLVVVDLQIWQRWRGHQPTHKHQLGHGISYLVCFKKSRFLTENRHERSSIKH